MMNDRGCIDAERYQLDRLADLPTPCLVVYQELVEENLAIIGRELEAAAPGAALGCLRPHVKTHKSSWAVRLQLAAGIEKFKCTHNELDMLLEEGVRDIFVAYPPLERLAERIAVATAQNSQVKILSQVSCIEHARYLAAAAEREGVELDYLIDLDVGDHRTGLPASKTRSLLAAIRSEETLSRLHLDGIHAYDGHNHSANPLERTECAREAMEEVARVLGEAREDGAAAVRLVISGTPGFLHCLEALRSREDLEAEIEVSPGTFIYWDTRYDELMPGRFRLAAMILARVMDRPTPRRITLDLGHKRWAIDQGHVHLFSTPGLEVAKVSEEHTVLEHDGSCPLKVGDPVLIAPRHVCATVNLWEKFHLVDDTGNLHAESLAVTARNR
ncbi:MAG: alanine racemase [Planctomycetota bacterium]|nr:alanine racemase [Planctomycetota bacterium]